MFFEEMLKKNKIDPTKNEVLRPPTRIAKYLGLLLNLKAVKIIGIQTNRDIVIISSIPKQ